MARGRFAGTREEPHMSIPRKPAGLAGAALASVLVLAMATLPAHAEPTMGERIKTAVDDLVGPLLFCVTLLCSLSGAFLFVRGLMKLKDAHQGQGEMRQAFVAIFCATCLIALPEAAGMGMMSMLGTNNVFFSTSELSMASDALDGASAASKAKPLSSSIANIVQPKGVSPCFSGGGVPCMAKNLAINVVPVAIIAVFAFVYVAGLWGFGSALLDLARHAGERGGGSPPGFWTKLVASVLMLAAPPLLNALSLSVMGDAGPVGLRGLDSGSSALSYTGTGQTGILLQYAQLIGYLFQILALFGVIAFVRGIFVLKGAGEQRQNATYSHGIVFMVAGVLLANAKLSTCTLMGTIVGFGSASNNVLGFCTSG